jgi:hypothetical protein
MNCVNEGMRFRAVASTLSNARSSRSHSVFTINIVQKMSDKTIRTGRLHLIDLAGSENLTKTGHIHKGEHTRA